MKVIITGASGLLGQYLNIELGKKNKIIALYNSREGNTKSYNSIRLNLEDFSALKKVILENKPDFVIHTAGITRPETADAMPYSEVKKINVEASRVIAESCESIKARMIFTSTDLVYDGNSGGMLPENGKINPLSSYAVSKVEAEEEIKSVTENYVILRTALLFGIGLNGSVNNFHILLENLRNRKLSYLFVDQLRTPLSLQNASRIISQIVDSGLKNLTLNLAGPERISRYELGKMLCEAGGFDETLLKKIYLKDISTVKPVYDVSLNTTLLRKLGLNQGELIQEIISTIQ